MYNLIFTTYEGVTSIVLCHESKEFLEELIEEVKEYNIESMALIKREIGPFKADYINSQEISNIEQNINNLKGAINAYMSIEYQCPVNNSKHSAKISNPVITETEDDDDSYRLIDIQCVCGKTHTYELSCISDL